MSYRKWYFIVVVIAVVGGILYVSGSLDTSSNTALKAIGLIMVVVAWILGFSKLRCPYCHKLLPDRYFHKVEYCPRCGKELEPK